MHRLQLCSILFIRPNSVVNPPPKNRSAPCYSERSIMTRASLNKGYAMKLICAFGGLKTNTYKEPQLRIRHHHFAYPRTNPLSKNVACRPSASPINANDTTKTSVCGDKGFARASASPQAGFSAVSYRMGLTAERTINMERSFLSLDAVKFDLRMGSSAPGQLSSNTLKL